MLIVDLLDVFISEIDQKRLDELLSLVCSASPALLSQLSLHDILLLKQDLLSFLRVSIDKSQYLNRALVQLTDREIEIIECAAAGLSQTEIATRLGIKVRTIRQHIDNAYIKLYVTSEVKDRTVMRKVVAKVFCADIMQRLAVNDDATA